MDSTIAEKMETIGRRARKASQALMGLSEEEKNQALKAMADELDNQREKIRKANELDVKDGRENGLSSAMIDRLILNDERIDAMIQGLHDIAALPDPIGKDLRTWDKENGLKLHKRAVPIGVIGMIYESRPNVTADAAALCLKASNAIILRGGSEALRSNQAIAEALNKGAKKAGLPEHALQLVPVRDRKAVQELIRMDRYVDVIIPRGGQGLIRAVAENATVPVLKHYEGICHIYVDADADHEKAWRIVENAKCQRPGVCNAVETLLVNKAIAPEWLPEMAEQLLKQKVELRGDEASRDYIKDVKPATEEDWSTEYLDLILSVKIVDGIKEAVEHINHYGSGHSDAIVSENSEQQDYFSRMVDSAAVYVNASTRFTDGAEFGMGAEIGISTDRLHARGPVGLEELTTYKYVITGNGQIRE
ncbi:glutamate-5-semialdehyde dehydrogenase [Gracilimonas mengyeensis]|uniref:Gamma-glutamyl phosphate reductase n=1 Tax=Gracilimonas mengyeensis TaxID=1302730 RepID=A0A521AJJ6_9BACT|nr:glutamate-5-semialdehyde dehydrogenase [Gracilimonas mengyeensis]SMO34941.1 glutamate-5-semialdehyde dehydrogenase [Gracilimonas mengyeensis]